MRGSGERSTEPAPLLLRRPRYLPTHPDPPLRIDAWLPPKHAPPRPPSSPSTPPPESSSARLRRSRRSRSRAWSTTSPGSSPPGPSCRSKDRAALHAPRRRRAARRHRRDRRAARQRAGQAARRGLHDGAAADRRRAALVRQGRAEDPRRREGADVAGLPDEQERPLHLRADRRRRGDRALELPLVDPLRRGRDRADGRQRRRPQAGQPDAAARARRSAASSRRAGCPRAWSGSSTAAARSATRWPARASARSSSPARSRSAARSARSAPSSSRARCWSSAARTR